MQDKAASNRAALARSAPLSRFSTSTVFGSKYLVPWLAAQGPLAYSPTEPPARDYFFQYSWILPGLFDPAVNLREHRYFGRYRKDSAKFLFDFWNNARKGSAPAHYILRGRVRGEDHRPKPALSGRSCWLPSGIHPPNGLHNRIISEVSC